MECPNCKHPFSFRSTFTILNPNRYLCPVCGMLLRLDRKSFVLSFAAGFLSGIGLFFVTARILLRAINGESGILWQVPALLLAVFGALLPLQYYIWRTGSWLLRIEAPAPDSVWRRRIGKALAFFGWCWTVAAAITVFVVLSDSHLDGSETFKPDGHLIWLLMYGLFFVPGAIFIRDGRRMQRAQKLQFGDWTDIGVITVLIVIFSFVFFRIAD